MKNKFKKHHYRKGRKRATSPIVATILLIGLTVLSGAILYEITMNYLNVQPKVGLSYQDPNVYQTSEKSFLFSTSKINSFDITVSNPNDQQMMINLAASNV